MDYTRAKLFISKNNLNIDEMDEFMCIIQDIQHQVVDDCQKITLEIMKIK